MNTVCEVWVRVLDQDPDRLELATARLRAELLETDVTDVRPGATVPAPPGSRSVDVAVVGSLLVTLSQAPDAIRQLVGYVQGWLARDPGDRSVELVIDGDRILVTGVSAATQQQLVEAWLARQAARRPEAS